MAMWSVTAFCPCQLTCLYGEDWLGPTHLCPFDVILSTQ